MPVYFIAQVQINDQAGYQAYQEAAAKAPFEGVKVLAMDDKPEVIEGTWSGPKTVILDFGTIPGGDPKQIIKWPHISVATLLKR